MWPTDFKQGSECPLTTLLYCTPFSLSIFLRLLWVKSFFQNWCRYIFVKRYESCDMGQIISGISTFLCCFPSICMNHQAKCFWFTLLDRKRRRNRNTLHANSGLSYSIVLDLIHISISHTFISVIIFYDILWKTLLAAGSVTFRHAQSRLKGEG